MSLTTISSFVEGLVRTQILDPEQRAEVLQLQETVADSRALAQELLHRDWLTAFQINQIFQGRAAGLVIGPYVLIERLGEGGMGQVFKARQKTLNRIVALKVIRQDCLDNPKAVLRFQREIQTASQLCHPHIVRAYDADQINGTYYFAMEYIDGVDMARLVKESGPLRVDRACEYIRQAALGLQHALERGMVHRDIKPANLLIARAVTSDRRRSSGTIRRPSAAELKAKSSGAMRRSEVIEYPWGIVKILDMGLARLTDPFSGRAETHLTQVGTVMGTPEFIAPEQARDSHQSDIRADLYSLGCTLYFLLAGQAPFPKGTLTEKLLQHQFDEPEPIGSVRCERLRACHGGSMPKMTHVPAPVVDVVCRLMAKRPEDRYQTPQELAGVLQLLLRQMADGTLPLVAAAADTQPFEALTPALLAGSGVELIPETSATVMRPLTPAPQRAPAGARRKALAPLIVTAFGGVVFLIVATGAAALIGLSNLIDASPVAPESTSKRLARDDPPWKQLLKKAAQKRGSWEDARQEMLRQRALLPDGPQGTEIDLWLARTPTPLDDLDRSRFGPALTTAIPADVIAVYGPAKPNEFKPVTAVAISSDGRWLVANEEKHIRFFDVAASIVPYKITGAHSQRVTSLAMSPDGRLLASAGEDGLVRVWDVHSHNRLFSFDKHQKKTVTQVVFSPDGSLLASAGKDGAIRLFDPRTGGELRKIEQPFGEILSLCFSSDGRTIFWGGQQDVYGMPIANVSRTPMKLGVKALGNRVLAVQPRGNWVVVAGNDGFLRVHTWDGSKLIEKMKLKQQSQVNQVVFAPDGQSFVSAGSDPAAVLWDTASFKAQKSWPTPRTPAYSAAFSADGRHVALGTTGNRAFVIRLAGFDLDTFKKSLGE